MLINYDEQNNDFDIMERELTDVDSLNSLTEDIYMPEAVFNGKSLDIYNRGARIKSIPAMSGLENRQCRKYTNVRSQGPIPEGSYNISYDSYEHYPEGHQFERNEYWKDRITGNLWRHLPDSWGNARAKIIPEKDTETFGRTKMYIHGGKTPGSLGCIDLTQGMKDFQEIFEKAQRDIPLTVRYDEECW